MKSPCGRATVWVWAVPLCCGFVVNCGNARNSEGAKVEAGAAGAFTASAGAGGAHTLAGAPSTGGALSAAGAPSAGAPSAGALSAGALSAGGAISGGGMSADSAGTGLSGGEADEPPPRTSYWQFGTSGSEEAFAVGVDAGENVYVALTSNGALIGTKKGLSWYMRKYDSKGIELWTQLLGVPQASVNRVAVEPSGDFFVVGEGSDPSDLSADHGYLEKCDSTGKSLWSRRFGARADVVALDSNHNVYVAGLTGELTPSVPGSLGLYLRKYDGSGNSQWTQKFGIPLIESATDMALDSVGNIYLSCRTQGTVEDPNTGLNDTSLRKFAADGSLQWTQTVATSADELARGVAVDPSGNIYLAGYTDGSLAGSNLGEDDAFIRKYDPQGNVLWTQQFGTEVRDIIFAVRVDSSGNPYVVGVTEGTLDGPASRAYNSFIRKYDPNGSPRWTKQTGNTQDDRVTALAIAASGNLYAVGFASGALGGPSAGLQDALVIKVEAMPGSFSGNLAG